MSFENRFTFSGEDSKSSIFISYSTHFAATLKLIFLNVMSNMVNYTK